MSDLVTRLRAAGCVFAEEEAELLLAATSSPATLEAMVTRRVSGEPLEYILGWVSFCGLHLGVDPGVFVPRRRTEFLVDQAVGRTRPGAVVLDLCCGAGAIGAAVTARVERVELYASDVDPVAVRCARRNLPGAQVYRGDLFDALPSSLRGRVEVLVANVPYVPTSAVALMPAEARDYEPLLALDGGADGLDILRRVAIAAPLWLAPGGQLLIEVSEQQAEAAATAFDRAGLAAGVAHSAELQATVIFGSS